MLGSLGEHHLQEEGSTPRTDTVPEVGVEVDTR